MMRIGFKATLTADGNAIAETVMVTLPDRTFGEAEITPLNQATFDRQFLSTLRDNGQCQVEIFYTPANYSAMLGLHGVNNKNYVFTTPDPDAAGPGTAQTLTMRGFLSVLGGPKAEKDQPMKFTITIRVNEVTVT